MTSKRCSRRSIWVSPTSDRSRSWWRTPAHRAGRLRVGPTAVGRGPRREPDGCLEYRASGDPSMIDHGRGGSIVLAKLDRRTDRDPIRRAGDVELHGRKARGDRSDALLGQLPGAAQHPREQRCSHDGSHAYGQRRQRVADHPACPGAADSLTNTLVEAVEASNIANTIAWLSSRGSPVRHRNGAPCRRRQRQSALSRITKPGRAATGWSRRTEIVRTL